MPTTRSSTRALARDESTYILDAMPWNKEGDKGTRLSILFNVGKKNEEWYAGTIADYNIVDKVYLIVFDDGDQRVFTTKELDADVHAGQLKILSRTRQSFYLFFLSSRTLLAVPGTAGRGR